MDKVIDCRFTRRVRCAVPTFCNEALYGTCNLECDDAVELSLTFVGDDSSNQQKMDNLLFNPNTRTQCQLPVMPVFQAMEIHEEDPIGLQNALPVPSLRQFKPICEYLNEQVILESAETANKLTFVSSTATEFQETSQCSLLEFHSVCKPTMVVAMTQFCNNSNTLCTLSTDTASCQSSYYQLPSHIGVMLQDTSSRLTEIPLSHTLSGLISDSYTLRLSSSNCESVLHFSELIFHWIGDVSKTIGFSKHILFICRSCITQTQYSNTQSKTYDPGIGTAVACHTVRIH